LNLYFNRYIDPIKIDTESYIKGSLQNSIYSIIKYLDLIESLLFQIRTKKFTGSGGFTDPAIELVKTRRLLVNTNKYSDKIYILETRKVL